MRIDIIKEETGVQEGKYCISSVLRCRFGMHFTVLSAGSVMIELLTVLEDAELVNCMDENPRHYSGALLLSPQYS